MKGKSNTYLAYTLIASPKIHTDLLWDLTILFVVLCVLYFGTIFFFRRKLSLGSKTIRKRKKELSPMISEFLFYDENAPKEEMTNYVNLKLEMRELLNDDFNRKVLIDILMDLRKDLSGATLNKLFELYQGLGLHQDSYKKLENWRWSYISKGIIELTQMNVTESYGLVTKFINSKRATIRKQAEIAIVTLRPEGINYFLDTTTHRISEWQQLKMLEVLKSKSDFQPPSFKHWLISKNKDVVLFSLRLMKHYNQSDGNRALIELLKHKNNEIKAAAVNCTKEFHAVEALETLKLVFWNATVDIKISILHAIAALGSANDLEFLESIGAKESNFNVKSKALATINAIAPLTVLPTKDIQDVGKFGVPKDLPTAAFQENDSEHTAIAEVEEELSEAFEIDSTASQKQKFEEDFEQFIQTPIKTEEAQPVGESATAETEVENSFKINFLPIVTEREKEDITDRYDPKSGFVDNDQDLLERDVIFETVQFKSISENEDKESPLLVNVEDVPDSLSESPLLDFLPLVVAPEKTSDISTSADMKNPIDISEIPVTYIEVKIETPETKDNRISSKLNELAPLPEAKKIIKKTKRKKNVDQNAQEPTSINNIDMKKIKKIKCKGVEIKTEKQKTVQENRPTIENTAQEKTDTPIEKNGQYILDWVMAENEAQGELKDKIKTLVIKQEAEGFNLPKPIFYGQHEANMMALLDDIEALGDEREVPLLTDLLREEANRELRTRMQHLIEKISNTVVLKSDPVIKADSTELFSIFEEYFRTIDTESKLILLDEIVAVGDEKEVAFLKRLSESASPEVKKKAQVCLEKLSAKLVQEKNQEPTEIPKHEEGLSQNESTVRNSEADSLLVVNEQELDKSFSVFDIDFELGTDDREEIKRMSK